MSAIDPNADIQMRKHETPLVREELRGQNYLKRIGPQEGSHAEILRLCDADPGGNDAQFEPGLCHPHFNSHRQQHLPRQLDKDA
jgi:hypothetical protein